MESVRGTLLQPFLLCQGDRLMAAANDAFKNPWGRRALGADEQHASVGSQSGSPFPFRIGQQVLQRGKAGDGGFAGDDRDIAMRAGCQLPHGFLGLGIADRHE